MSTIACRAAAGPPWRLVVILALVALLAGPTTVLAQAAGEPAAAAADEEPDAAEDLDVLVAPIALYPDPLLAAVLQATVMPLDVVNAAQFLRAYQNDPSLEPDPQWDPAVRALLGFPTVLEAMDAHRDWVDAMGDAVLDRLPDVQESVQQVRAEFHAGGVLVSNEHQNVVVEKNVIRIEPTDPRRIFLPVYDPAALVEAVEGDDVAALIEQAAQAQEGISTPEPAPAEVATPAPAEASEATESAAPEATAVEAPSEAVVAAQPSEPLPTAMPAPTAPLSYAPPVSYAAPVTYAVPSDGSSAWSTVGTFAGGALVGGILGYVIGDDDNNDDDYNGWFNDNDDLDEFWDEARDVREESREDWQSYLDEGRNERQDRAEQARDARQQRAEETRERRDQQREQTAAQRGERRETTASTRKDRTAQTQAKLDQRAQRSAEQKRQVAAREGQRKAAPSPTGRQKSASRQLAQRPVPKLENTGAMKATRQDTATVPRQGKAAASGAQKKARVGDARATPRHSAAIGDVKRGSTVKKEQARGSRSRAASSAGGQRKEVASASSRPQASRGGGGRSTQRAAQGGGGREASAHGSRGKASRRR